MLGRKPALEAQSRSPPPARGRAVGGVLDMGGVRTPVTISVVLMGVSGCGKTAVGRLAAARLGWPYREGDELHPAANVAKMAAGHPLDDEDRWPWLQAVAAWIGEREQSREDALITCSALKRSYRGLLSTDHSSVWFVHLDVDPDVLRARLRARRGHFMPPSLLESQLAALQSLGPDEPGATISADAALDVVVGRVIESLPALGQLR